MKLIDKLTQADEFIWRQHEKIVQHAHQEYGWNKYDCVRLTGKVESLFLLGNSIYCSIMGVQIAEPTLIATGIVYGLITPKFYSSNQRKNTEMEIKELKVFEETGVFNPPKFNPLRPLGIVGSILSSGFGIEALVGDPLSLVGDKLTGNEIVAGLFAITMGGYGLCALIGSYFSDQIMTPPTKKRSIFKTLYERIAKKSNPVPQLQPTKYQSVDDLVMGG